MSDLERGLSPQFVKEDEGNTDVLNQILVELKKINTYMSIMTDNIVNEQDIIESKEDII